MWCTSSSAVLNLRFGRVLDTPISTSWRFEDAHRTTPPFPVHFSLLNSDDEFQREQEHETRNSQGNRQTPGFNHRACVRTGTLRVSYPDYNEQYANIYSDWVSSFIRTTYSLVLTFFQRRRVVVNHVHIRPRRSQAILLGMGMAASWVDSVSHGPLTVPVEQTGIRLTQAMTHLSSVSEEDRNTAGMLLLRYNESLNLPYAYERIESFFRILEAFGATLGAPSCNDAEYTRIKSVLGVRRNSATLRKFVDGVLHARTNYTDQDLQCFHYRNQLTHEYLSPSVVTHPDIGRTYRFLQACVDSLVCVQLGLRPTDIQRARYSVIDGRLI